MSWPHCTKTHKLVRFLGNGPFPDQGPVGGAHGASSPTQQYDFFAEQTLKISVYFMQQIKSYSIFTVRQTDRHTDRQTHRQTHILHPYMHVQDFFLYGNLYLSLHYVPSFALLTHSLHLWRIRNFTNVLKYHAKDEHNSCDWTFKHRNKYSRFNKGFKK